MKILFRDIERGKLAWVCIHGKGMENQAEPFFRESIFLPQLFSFLGMIKEKHMKAFWGISSETIIGG
jgi:hypothetical protein